MLQSTHRKVKREKALCRAVHTDNTNARMRQPRSTHTRPPFGASVKQSRAPFSTFAPPSSKQSNDGSMHFHSTKREYLHSRGASASQTFTRQHMLQREKKKNNESLFFFFFVLSRSTERARLAVHPRLLSAKAALSGPPLRVPQSMEGTRDGGPLKVRGCRWPLGGVMLQKAVHRGPCTSMRCRFWQRFRSSSKLKGYSGPGPLP